MTPEKAPVKIDGGILSQLAGTVATSVVIEIVAHGRPLPNTVFL